MPGSSHAFLYLAKLLVCPYWHLCYCHKTFTKTNPFGREGLFFFSVFIVLLHWGQKVERDQRRDMEESCV